MARLINEQSVRTREVYVTLCSVVSMLHVSKLYTYAIIFSLYRIMFFLPLKVVTKVGPHHLSRYKLKLKPFAQYTYEHGGKLL